MPPRSAAVPPASRKTLLEWIDHDDGDTSGTAQPTCSREAQDLHAKVYAALGLEARGGFEPLQPPPGLHLAPIG